jgi:hypothetical protein
MRTRHIASLVLSLFAAAACAVDSGSAIPMPTEASLSEDGHHGNGAVVTEPSWYNGERYLIAVPSAGSANPNQFPVACFRLGVNLNNQRATGPTGTMYAILNPVNPDHPSECFPHDHVLSAVPGVQGYAPRWQVVIGLPGANFHPSILPLTSEAAVLAAAAAGQIVLVSPVTLLGAQGDILLAPVIGRASH